MPEFGEMSRLRSVNLLLDAWVRPFRRTTLQLTANTRIGGSPFAWDGSSTIRTSKDRKQLARPMRQPPVLSVLQRGKEHQMWSVVIPFVV